VEKMKKPTAEDYERMIEEARGIRREIDAKTAGCEGWGAVLPVPIADIGHAIGAMKAAFRKLMLSGHMSDAKRETVRSEAIEEHRQAAAKLDRLVGQL